MSNARKLLLATKVYQENKNKIQKWLKEYVSNSTWIGEHLDELKKKYPDMYIAVYKRKVIKTGKDLRKIKEEIEKELGDESKGVAIEFLSSKPVKYLFPTKWLT